MKIAEYNDMMSYLTRPAPQTQVADLVDDLEPGALKDELKEKFDPSQETYEEYLQRKGLGERPFNASEGGSPLVPKPKPYTLEQFQEKADLYIKGALGGFPKDEMINKLQLELDKAEEAGILSREEAINFLNERTQQIKEFIQNNPGEADLSRVKKAIGGGVIEGEDLGTREGFNVIKTKMGGTNVETGQGFQPGNPGNIQALEKLMKEKTALKDKKVKKFVELVEKGNSTTDAKNKVIKLFRLTRKKGSGTPPWMTEGKNILVDKGVLEEKERGSVKVIGKTEDFSKDKNIKLLSKKTIEPGIKEAKYKNLTTGETFIKYKPLLRSNTVTVSGAGFDTLEQAQQTVKDYNEANPKKTFVTLKLEENLRTLANNKRLAPLLESGVPDKKYLKVVQDILDLNVSQAEDKLKQLGEAVRPNSNFDVPGIDKIDEDKATNISNFYKSKSVSKKVVDQAIGESVGEKSLKNLRADVQRELPFGGGPETFETDEAKAKMGSFRLGSKPYSIFGQVIDGRLNQGDKMRYDALLSRLEEDVQKALKGELIRDGKKITPQEAVARYNAAATEAEKEFNSQKMRNFKPVRIPKITLDSPDKAIANKAAYKKYKPYFDNNYKQLGYSFKIPKDLKPIPEIAADLKNTNSSEYKNMIRNVKEIGKKFIKDINKYDEKDLLKIFNDPKFQKFKRLMPRLVSNDDFSERLYASADNIMSDAGPINLMPAPKEDEEQTFAERNPITTGVGLTVPSAVAVQKAAGVPVLKALANIGKYPLKAVGSLPGAALFAGDTIAERLEEGRSIPDAVIDKEVGIELLFPEAFKRFGPLMMKAARLTTPLGATITAAGLAKDAYQRAQELKAMSPEERAELARIRDDFSFGEYSGAKDGGIMRIGFADGPEDPSKRKFMKIMGGLASLPILGRFFKIGEKAAPIIDAVKTEAVKGKPEWFDALVNKVIRMGEDVTDRFATVDRETVNQIDIAEGETVRVYRNVDEGTVRVEYENPDNMGGDSVNLVYKKPLPDEGDPSPSANFYATELEPRGIRTGPDDYDVEFDGENYADSVDELMSDTTKLKEFATGQKRTMKEIVESKKKKDKTKAMNESTMEQAEYLESKYGPGDDLYYQDYSDYD